MTMFTPQAAEAIDWLFKCIPERHFNSFRDDMDCAMRVVLQKYGFDQAVIDGFNVNQLVADRIPTFITVPVTLYEGQGKYAQRRSGNFPQIYAFKDGEWAKSRLTLAEVKSMSITAVPGNMKIRSDKL
ncbi:hypothetical protein [Leclercia sp.]|uniref:hypothetical protein n=1 Tax=Leclercia sp. TaxID=1898428 RepID=UPI002FDD47A5